MDEATQTATGVQALISRKPVLDARLEEVGRALELAVASVNVNIRAVPNNSLLIPLHSRMKNL